ncbi:hypothetical protein DL771_011932 [Monosporascus sp. 5C6A]|nr:hypothetical protein DL771_011932 [Monosporascus sp. 5C6A]
MSGKLDQSLDEILSTQRRAAGGRRRSQRRSSGRPAPAAPVGGVQKNLKQPRAAATKQAPAKATGGHGESKVVVSNLPKDVNEAQIKTTGMVVIEVRPDYSLAEQTLLSSLVSFPIRTRSNVQTSPNLGISQPATSQVYLSRLSLGGGLLPSGGDGFNPASIAEYFKTSVGPIKRVEVSYGPGGVSRGIATVTFAQLDGASKAFNALNGILVDNRPIKVSSNLGRLLTQSAHTIKIEIVVGGAKAAQVAPPAKTLTERITQPKAQPKSAANDKKKEAAAKAAGSGARGRGGKKKPRNARPAKKTTEELDSEMADYFESGNQQTNENAGGGAAATTNGGDAPMDDEIM